MMKTIIAAAMLLTTTAAMAEQNFCQRVLPPNSLRAEPTVEYSIRYTSDPSTKCKSDAMSCAGRCNVQEDWVIWIDRDFNDIDKACAILHEKAHLPPNNWKANHMGSRDEPLPMHAGAWMPACH